MTDINYADFFESKDRVRHTALMQHATVGDAASFNSLLGDIEVSLHPLIWTQYKNRLFPALPKSPGVMPPKPVPPTSTSVVTPATSVVVPTFQPAPATSSVSESDLKSMWTDIEDFNVDLLNKEILKSFEYQGFNPDKILIALIQAQRAESISKEDFLKDITTMVALAMIKGSVNDNNLKKMSDSGKAVYSRLEKVYKLKRGGARGKSSDVVTIARVAATFPAKVVELLQKKLVEGRQFVGDLQTYKLPAILRHQAVAAVIPKDLPERTKWFLLNLITAFSADQSKVISRSKQDIVTILETQRQFTMTAHVGIHPSEPQRKKIFLQYEWSKLYSDILPVAQRIKEKWAEFEVVNQSDFNQDLLKLS